ncbi:inter-alpha-trypsin inhibitor heavy chain H4-like isoform X2 [Thrips palmi]|uniref:Inter-alpha-trypsin inhibitor heavy chain H4-like isoform X2 n=1 Tax=Thrips palmi TaxID=161013 RepID=A0A6P8ZLP9_THRPL|nr:inter-alpha-trypsin inhibitor heavy chain H4-like isoform X2 [Thrips palmi]
MVPLAMGHLSGVAFLAALVLCAGPAPSASLPRPDDGVLVVTTTASTPASAAPTTPDAPTEEKAAPPPQVRSLHVNSLVQYRYAHTVVSSRVANPANKSQEVTFAVVLPETAFISSFAMEVDGKVYKAYVKEKEEAKQTYDAAVASGQSAAHVAVSARDSNSFTVSLNVEKQNKVSFNLTYEELLTRKLGQYEHVVTLNPGQVVQDLLVRVHIKENKNITKLRVPEFTSGNKIDADIQDCDEGAKPGASPAKCSSGNSMATIAWKTPQDVEVVFRPTAEEQKEIMDKLEQEKKKREEKVGRRGFDSASWDGVFEPSDSTRGDKHGDNGLNGQFSVQYDVDRKADGGQVVVNDGYFVHFFSPEELKPLKKHAIFVLDVSGSMDGRKIEQLREAMTAILDDLKEGDYFNLIAFSSDIKVWNLDKPSESPTYRPSELSFYPGDASTTQAPPADRPPAYRATKDNIAKAKNIVKQMAAYGGTNIFDALKTALLCVRDGKTSAAMSDSDQPLEPIILFLTDGDPTVGQTVPSKITSGISELNHQPRAAIFSLAFGDGADVKFLRKVSLANEGFARTIYEAADASLQLKNFYRQISSPLLANVSFQYLPDKVERDSMTQLQFRTFFDGTELIVAGRTADKGVQEVGGNVLGTTDGGKLVTYAPHTVGTDEPLTIYPFDEEGPLFNATQGPRHASVLERLWAYLTIKQLLDKQDALDASVAKDEVIVPTWVRPAPPPQPPVALPVQPGQPGTVEAATTPTAAPAAPTTPSFSPPADGLDLSLFQQEEPKKRALKLALKYSFVTPLTSLVVVKPNETKATDAMTVNPVDATAEALQGGFVSRLARPSLVSPMFISGGLGAGVGAMPLGLSSGHHSAMMSPAPPGWGGVASGLGASGPPGFSVLPGYPVPYRSTGFTGNSMPINLQSLSMPAFPGQQLAFDRVGHGGHATLLSLAGPVLANISDVKWLPKDSLQKGSIPLTVNGTLKTFKIASNQTDPEPPQNCQVEGSTSGVCRHFTNCVLGQVVERIEDFVKYQCPIGDYLAICCPLDTVQTPTPSSTQP